MVTYHEWTALLRAHTRACAEKGMLGVIAAQTGIPEGRLRLWSEDDGHKPLSHTEFQSLHEVLSEHVSVSAQDIKGENNVTAADKRPPFSNISTGDSSSTEVGRTCQSAAFDSSD